MSSHLIVFDQLVAIVNANAAFWSDLGAHELRTSALGQRLGAFLRDSWNPWYAQVIQLAAHDLDDAQQARFCVNVASQLVQLRDTAGYKYQLPMLYQGDPDAQLAEIEDQADFVVEAMAINKNAGREIAARRPPLQQRRR